MFDFLCCRVTLRSRLNDINCTLDELSQSLTNTSPSGLKTEIEYKIKSAKLKAERLQAMETVMRSLAILAEIDILIAEHDLNAEVDLLKSYSESDLERHVRVEDKSPSESNCSYIDKSCQTSTLDSTPKMEKDINNTDSHSLRTNINENTNTGITCSQMPLDPKPSNVRVHQTHATTENDSQQKDKTIFEFGTACNVEKDGSFSKSIFEFRPLEWKTKLDWKTCGKDKSPTPVHKHTGNSCQKSVLRSTAKYSKSLDNSDLSSSFKQKPIKFSQEPVEQQSCSQPPSTNALSQIGGKFA